MEVFNSLGKSLFNLAYGSMTIGTGAVKPGLNYLSKGIGSSVALAGIGAGIGAGLGLRFNADNETIATTTAVGGTVGAMAIPAIGLGAGIIGNAGVGLAKATPGIAKGVGKFAMRASPFVVGTAINGIGAVSSAVYGVGSQMINWNEGADALDKVKFSTPISNSINGWKNGKGVGKFTGAIKGGIINGTNMLGMTAIAEGAQKAWNTLNQAKMGQNVGVINSTPQIPSYVDNANATGDLVFAMNANRRG